MLFNSYVFIFAFLPVVVAGYALLNRYASNRTWVIGWLVLASLFYYGWWKPQFLLLLFGSVSVNALLGKGLIEGRLSAAARKAALVAGIAFNVGLLGYFKYAMFFVDNLNSLFGAGLTVPKIVLPIGISFITFQKIAYLVDAYKGLVKHFSLRNYALFVTFFPQLIAGPIVHHAEMMPQFERTARHRDFADDLAIGFSIFCVGLFKKVVIADTCAVYADAGYAHVQAGNLLDFVSAWMTVVAYSFQLYYDFSGYSDMAIGLARIFGIRLPVNFNSPYKATSIIDFWRRWHMTLSRFLRDYIYIPLGGNRRGGVRRYVNLMIVMLIGGFWHGANWTFVLWGGIHGVLLALNHAWHALPVSGWMLWTRARYRLIFGATTFLIVTLAWVPFRSPDLVTARRMRHLLFPSHVPFTDVVRSLRAFWRSQIWDGRYAYDVLAWFKARELWPAPMPEDFLTTYRPAGLLLICIAVLTFVAPNTQELFARMRPVAGANSEPGRWAIRQFDARVAILISGMFVVAVLFLSRVSPFLYFQF